MSSIQQHRNYVELAGVLSRVPTTRTTASGKTVANFMLTTTTKDRSETHRIVAWERLADKVGGLAQGEFVQLTGRLQSRSYNDKTGVTRYVTEIVASQLVVPSREPVTVSTTGVEVTDADLGF